MESNCSRTSAGASWPSEFTGAGATTLATTRAEGTLIVNSSDTGTGSFGPQDASANQAGNESFQKLLTRCYEPTPLLLFANRFLKGNFIIHGPFTNILKASLSFFANIAFIHIVAS